MNSIKSKINLPAIICVCVMLLSYFLPWYITSGSVSVPGYSSSYSSIKIGFDAGGWAIISFIIGLLCLVFVLVRSKVMIIPGIINAMFSLLYLTSLNSASISVSTGFGSGYAGAGYGLYIFVISSIAFLIFSIIPRYSIKFKNEDLIQDQTLSQNLERKTDSTFILLKTYKKQIIWIISLIVVGFIIKMTVTYVLKEQKRKRWAAEFDENGRLRLLQDKINQEISNEEFSIALRDAENLKWQLDTGNEYNTYEDLRSQTIEQINNAIQAKKEAQENAREEDEAFRQAAIQDSISPSTIGNLVFPLRVKVKSKICIMYSQPNINSEKVNIIPMNEVLTVSNMESDFYFCEYALDMETKVSGWIYNTDLEKIE